MITPDIKQSRDSSGHVLENNGRKMKNYNERQWAWFRRFSLNVPGNKRFSQGTCIAGTGQQWFEKHSRKSPEREQ